MVDSNFPQNTQMIMIISFVLLAASVFCFEFFKNKKSSFFLLLAGGIGIKLFMILLCPYLYGWDEAFHALVAKHMMNHPFYPTLYQKTFFEHGLGWADTTIWVHKQPWFLWQMALSMKIFGVNAFAVRIPSLIIMSAGIFFIYDIGKKLASERIGFYAAFLFCLNNYINEQTAGSIATDHNDVVFMGLILAGFWALIKYISFPKIKYMVLIGVFCGLAILTKWLVALIIFFCWFWYIIITNKAKSYQIKLYFDFIKSLLIAGLIAVPWQIYILWRFPLQAATEYDFNRKHITEALDGHTGDYYYYYDGLIRQYGYLSTLFCLMGIVLLHKYVKNKAMYYALLISFLFVYIFFTFVETKMHGFTLVVSLLIFLGFGAIAENLNERFMYKSNFFIKMAFTTIALTIGYFTFDLQAIQDRHTTSKLVEKNMFYMEREYEFKEICDYIRNTEKDTSYVYFNCDFPRNINFMFETDFIGYSRLPNEVDIKTIKEKGHKVAVIDYGVLPTNIENNKDIKIISLDKFKVIKRDTCYIKSLKYGYISEVNKHLLCNNNKTKFIISYYKDGHAHIKNKDGMSTRIAFDQGGSICMDGTNFYSNEKIEMEYVDDKSFKIKTFQNKYYKVTDNGENVVSDEYLNRNEFKFTLSKD
jgi:4-amino-4-deoxy-L-arabinose transferase-like glycosyltransferase